MSFHEKSALACLTSICVVYVPYFVVVFRYPMAALGLIWLSAIGLVVLLGAFHFAIAIATRSVRRTFDTPPVDELDQRIELRAAKWASVTLASAVVTWILYAMYSMPAIGAGVFEQVTANGAEVSSSDFAVPVFMAWQPFSGCSPDSYSRTSRTTAGSSSDIGEWPVHEVVITDRIRELRFKTCVRRSAPDACSVHHVAARAESCPLPARVTFSTGVLCSSGVRCHSRAPARLDS